MQLGLGLHARNSAGSRPGAWTPTAPQDGQVDFALFLSHFGDDATMSIFCWINVSNVIYYTPRKTTSI